MTPELISFVKGFEGCVLHPYLDASNTPTIGYGFTYYPSGLKVTMQDAPLTQQEADDDFDALLQPYISGVTEACAPIVLNSNQSTACTDFAYNCGLGAFKTSTLLQHILSGCVVESDFTEYDHVGQEVDQVLLKRRQAEYQLYITPIKPMEPETNAETVESQDGQTAAQMITPNFETEANGKYCMITGFSYDEGTNQTSINYTAFTTDESNVIHEDTVATMIADGNLDEAAAVAYVEANNVGDYKVSTNITQ